MEISNRILEVIPIEVITSIIFPHLYKFRTISKCAAPLLVNKSWSQNYRHPLCTFMAGRFDEIMLRFPPIYYVRNRDDMSRLDVSLPMMRQLKRLQERDERSDEQFVYHEQFILQNMFSHSIRTWFRSKSESIAQVLKQMDTHMYLRATYLPENFTEYTSYLNDSRLYTMVLLYKPYKIEAFKQRIKIKDLASAQEMFRAMGYPIWEYQTI